MNRRLLRYSLVCVTGTLMLAAKPMTAMAYEEAVAGFTHDKIITADASNDSDVTISSLATYEIPIPGFTNIGIANVDTNLMIRSGPGEDYKLLGKLPKNGGCEIIESGKDGWTKISSGKVTGYVNNMYLITGAEATQLAKKVGYYVARANTDGLRVRKEPSTDAEVIDQIAKGEELLVLDSKIFTDDTKYSKWVKVSLDSDDSENGTVAYVAKEYVNLSFQLPKAVSMEELQFGPGVSSTRLKLITLAKKYLGDAYVWGGTRLGSGVDCSGYTQALYRQLGIYIPRTSREQARGGRSISSSSLKPGDLVFYGSSSYINHVAIYIGNGQVIHASNRRDGIKISNMYYRSPVKYARYISD
jgi:cell wall-associated NlpC family hydrolase